MKKSVIFIGAILLLTQTVFAAVTFTSRDGGSNLVEAEYSFDRLNDKSSLRREWKTAHDTDLPIDIVGTAGIKISYTESSRYTSGGYSFDSNINLKSSEDVSAVEVIILVFDIWGQLQAKLSVTEVQDLAKNETLSIKPSWNISSIHKATEALSSLAYVYQVRTKSGKIFTADLEAISKEAQKYAKELTPEAIRDFN